MHWSCLTQHNYRTENPFCHGAVPGCVKIAGKPSPRQTRDWVEYDISAYEKVLEQINKYQLESFSDRRLKEMAAEIKTRGLREEKPSG